MNAVELIEEIKRLPEEEQIKVVEFVRHLPNAETIEAINEPIEGLRRCKSMRSITGEAAWPARNSCPGSASLDRLVRLASVTGSSQTSQIDWIDVSGERAGPLSGRLILREIYHGRGGLASSS